jgi:hypothetical protein
MTWVVAGALSVLVRFGANALRRRFGEPSTPRNELDRIERTAPLVGSVLGAVFAVFMMQEAPFSPLIYGLLLFVPAASVFSALAGMLIVLPGAWRRRRAEGGGPSP